METGYAWRSTPLELRASLKDAQVTCYAAVETVCQTDQRVANGDKTGDVHLW